MQKTKYRAITLALLAAIVLSLIPIVAAIDIENIAIEKANPPSTIGLQIPVGQRLNLSFANVTILGAQFSLYISADGLASINPGDKVIGPVSGLFDTANLTSTTLESIYPGGFRVGWQWINITMPAMLPDGTQLPGGKYYIKMWDGNPADTVVTDTYFYLLGGISLTPISGPAGAALSMTGSAFLPNDKVNVTATLGSAKNLIPTNEYGVFVLPQPDDTFVAPDTMVEIPAGLQPGTTGFVVITYTATQNSTGVSAPSKTYTEYARGWKRIGSANLMTPGNTNVYGNNTDLTGTVSAAVTSSITIAGQYFYPGTVSIYMDNSVLLVTTTAGSTGSFSTSVTIPNTIVGTHTIQAKDAGGVTLNASITVIPTLILTPNTGPVGTTYLTTGLGLPATTKLYLYWFEVSSGSGTWHWTNNVTTTADGQINPGVPFTVPHVYGGAHPVSAFAAYSGTSTTTPGTAVASASFTVTSTFAVTPTNSLNNTGNVFYGNGTGFPVGEGATFIPNIDNNYLGIDTFGSVYATSVQAASNGDLLFQFVDAGFSPGTHVVSLYAIGQTSVTQKALFTVASQTVADASTVLLNAINQTVTQTNSTLNDLGITILSINGTVAMINTNTGTLSASISSLNASIVDLQNTIVTLNTNIGQVTTTLNQINATVNTISGNVVTLNTNIGTLTTTLNAIGANITSIKGSVATLITNLGAVTTQITGVASQVTGVANQVTGVSSQVSGIAGSISSVTNGMAQVQTAVGALNTPLANLDAKLVALNGTVATISTTLGTVQTSLASITTGVTTNGQGIATIQTTLGTIQGAMATKDGVTSVQTALGTVQTDLGTLQTDLNSTKSTTEGLSPLIIVAIVLALVAAIAAIASIVLMRRKIAG